MEDIALASAAVLALADVRPALVTHAQVERASRGGAAPVCTEDIGDALRLCYRVRERTPDLGEVERWLLPVDLAGAGLDVASVRAFVEKQVRERAPALLQSVPVQGMKASYLLSADGDGWSPGLVLVPDLLAARAGAAPLRVAAPSWGVVLVWGASSPALELAMAVGVYEMHRVQRPAVSDVIVTWEDGRWWSWGRAVPEAAAPVSDPAR